MKVLIVHGDQPEWLGLTQFSTTFAAWLIRQGHDCVVTYADHTTCKLITVGVDSDVLDIHAVNPDVIVVVSLPPPRSYKFLTHILDQCKGKRVMIHNNHWEMPTPSAVAVTRACDIIFSLASDDEYANIARTCKADIFAAGSPILVRSFQPGFDFNRTKQTYWQPITNTNPYRHVWIGRGAEWKGYDVFNKFSNDLRTDARSVTLALGVEKPYVRREALDLMSRSGFGYQLSALPDGYVDKALEYTHCEIVACGAIPVFHKKYGDMCKHRTTGTPLTQYTNTGTLWLDYDNVDQVMQTIRQLQQDAGMRDDWRHMAYEFYAGHQDSSVAFPHIWNQICM